MIHKHMLFIVLLVQIISLKTSHAEWEMVDSNILNRKIQNVGRIDTIAINELTKKLYVCEGQLGNIHVIDTETMLIIDKIDIGVGMTKVLVDEKTNSIYTCNYNSTIKIDGNTNTIISSIVLSDKTGYFGLDMDYEKQKIFIGVQTSSNSYICVIECESFIEEQRIIIEESNLISMRNICVDQSTHNVYIGNIQESSIQVFDGETYKLINEIKLDRPPYSMIMNNQTGFLYVGNNNGFLDPPVKSKKFCKSTLQYVFHCLLYFGDLALTDFDTPL